MVIGLALICLIPGGHGEVSESIYLLVQMKTENAVGKVAWPSTEKPQGREGNLAHCLSWDLSLLITRLWALMQNGI